MLQLLPNLTTQLTTLRGIKFFIFFNWNKWSGTWVKKSELKCPFHLLPWTNDHFVKLKKEGKSFTSQTFAETSRVSYQHFCSPPLHPTSELPHPFEVHSAGTKSTVHFENPPPRRSPPSLRRPPCLRSAPSLRGPPSTQSPSYELGETSKDESSALDNISLS